MRLDAITKDTRLCISLAGRPSNIGTRFHNYLYDELGLDFVYKAFTTDDLPAAIAGVRALGIRGAGISMPFKEDVLPLVDVVAPSAAAISSVNTIVNDNGRLTAYNTDYEAVLALLSDRRVPVGYSFALLGSGGMARAVLAAVRRHGLSRGTVIARNEANGRGLAEAYGVGWRPTLLDAPELLINATPIGMIGSQEGVQAFDDRLLDSARAVIDVVAMPAETPLIVAARERGLAVITGADIIALQAAAQFELYTGVRPTPDQVLRASAHSRS